MSQLTLADCWPRLFPLLAGAAVLRGSSQPNSRCLPKPAPARPSPSSGRRRRDWWCRGAIVSLRICRRSARILPRAAGRYGFAAPAAVWCQGPGIINLSLAWPVQQPLGEAAEPIYHSLCAVLQRTLARFGVASHARTVNGSFCDGRYNLACGEGEAARKIVGTAQYWRPLAAGGGHVVLAHAVILIDADLSAAHQAANAFEAQLGSERVYCADKTVTLAQLLPGERHLLPRFSETLAQELDAAR